MEKISREEFYTNIYLQILIEVRDIINLAVEKCGFSKKVVAEILGVSPPTITEWYYGKKTPSLKHYFALQYLHTVLSIYARVKNDK